jgi:hypothetical protein
MGDGTSVGLNVNASTFTVGTVTGSNAGTGFSPGPWTTNIGSSNVSQFGKFNLTIDSFDGFSNSSDTISVPLVNTSSTPWNTASDVLINNAKLNNAVAHIFVTTSPANQANGASVTGFASGVPEFGSGVLMSLMVVGFAGLEGLRRLRRKA